jgi:NAD+ diphosphatase
MLVTPPNFVPFDAQPGRVATLRRFVFRGSDVLVGETGALPDETVIGTYGASLSEPEDVGALGDVGYVVHFVPSTAEPPRGYRFQGIRSLWSLWDEPQVAVAVRAFQLQNWARTHRFCGACGAATERIPNERGIKCPACGFCAYPRISPAMMVLITRGDAMLLASNVNFPPNRYSALAGFLEIGENIEDAVHREVMEEVGLRVKNLRYFASQSWPFPHSLMIAFNAEYESGDIRVDPNEIRHAQWFGPNDPLPDLPPHLSIARALVDSHLARWSI